MLSEETQVPMGPHVSILPAVPAKHRSIAHKRDIHPKLGLAYCLGFSEAWVP